jgi:hypothetical protein
MDLHPEFKKLVVNNEVVIPDLTKRQSNLFVTYVLNNLYWALPTNYSDTLLSDEEEFEDAVKIHRAGGKYRLPGLVSLARQVIFDLLRGQVSIHFIINTFESDPVWRDANAAWIRTAVALRARTIEPYSLLTDLADYADEVKTKSPVLDGLLEGLIVVKGRIPAVLVTADPYNLIN